MPPPPAIESTNPATNPVRNSKGKIHHSKTGIFRLKAATTRGVVTKSPGRDKRQNRKMTNLLCSMANAP
jgi:hypothetical protein